MTEEQLIERVAQIIDHDAWHPFLKADGCGAWWMTRRAKATDQARDILAVIREREVDAIREALEPVLHWYQSDEHPDRSTAEIVRDIVADLQRDRAAVVRESEGWQPIETAPKHGEIEVRGDAGPYGISSWTGLAHWGLPTNWHRDNATWLSHAGAVLRLAGYYPREWRPIPPPPKTEGEG